MSIFRPAAKGLLAAMGAASLAACAAGVPPPGPVSVTRFVEPANLAQYDGARFFVETAPGREELASELAPYKAAIAAELAERGYVESDREGADFIAQVRLDQSVSGTPRDRQSPVSVGVGGSTGSYGSGVGVGIGINLGGDRRRGEELTTELGVMLRDKASAATFWEGRAQFSVSVNSPFANSETGATAVADAMFREFPGNNGETIEVRVSE